jgi:hypothetical protein
MIGRFQLLPQSQMVVGGEMARPMFSVLGIKAKFRGEAAKDLFLFFTRS